MKVMIGVPSTNEGGAEAVKGLLMDKFGISPSEERPFKDGGGTYYLYEDFDEERMLESAINAGATMFHPLE